MVLAGNIVRFVPMVSLEMQSMQKIVQNVNVWNVEVHIVTGKLDNATVYLMLLESCVIVVKLVILWYKSLHRLHCRPGWVKVIGTLDSERQCYHYDAIICTITMVSLLNGWRSSYGPVQMYAFCKIYPTYHCQNWYISNISWIFVTDESIIFELSRTNQRTNHADNHITSVPGRSTYLAKIIIQRLLAYCYCGRHASEQVSHLLFSWNCQPEARSMLSFN